MSASVSFVDSHSPIINLFLPNRIVARALCSSLNQCWLILVGTHEIKGQAIPVKAWPTKAKLNLESDERPSLKWGRVLRQQRSPPGIIEMTIIRMKQVEVMYVWANPLLKKSGIGYCPLYMHGEASKRVLSCCVDIDEVNAIQNCWKVWTLPDKSAGSNWVQGLFKIRI